jgi:4-hydroxy-tetrahydrodipicolinate synthase
MTAAPSTPDWKGIFPYLVTPSGPDGELDTVRLAALVEGLLVTGVHGVTALGSTGEFAHLAAREREATIATVVETVAGKVPVVAGVGGFRTADAVAQARRAAELGADGLLVIMLGYGQPRDAEIKAFVGAVADATDLPLVLYHHPSLCHVTIGLPLLEELTALPTLRFFKESTGSLALFGRSEHLASLGIRLFASTSISPVAAMLLGAVGWMAGLSCVFPAQSVEIHRRCETGDWAGAIALERAMHPAMERFRALGPARTTKAFLRAADQDMGEPFAPTLPVSDDLTQTLQQIRAAFAAAGTQQPEPEMIRAPSTLNDD